MIVRDSRLQQYNNALCMQSAVENDNNITKLYFEMSTDRTLMYDEIQKSFFIHKLPILFKRQMTWLAISPNGYNVLVYYHIKNLWRGQLVVEWPIGIIFFSKNQLSQRSVHSDLSKNIDVRYPFILTTLYYNILLL